jgi:heptosyltransferase-1
MPPTAIDTSKVHRVLIIKLSAIGDILHALPVSAALGESFPHWEISWAVEEPFKSLLEGNPYLKEVLPVPKLRSKTLTQASARSDYLNRLRELRKREFDLVLDLQGLTKSAILAVASGAKARLGYHWLREAAKFVEVAVPRRPESVHIVDQYLDVARHLGAITDPVRFPFIVSEADKSHVESLLRAEGITQETPFVTLNPASALAIKQWGAERYAALIDALAQRGVRSVLVTADRAVAEAVAQNANEPFVNLVGKTSLTQLGGVLERGAVHVCGDTGSGHLATALGRPVVSLVGPTDPDRACPYGQRANVITHREVCDSRCNWHHCAFPQPHCMAAITVQEAQAKVEQLLEQSKTPSP